MLLVKDNTIDKYEIVGKITRIQYSAKPEHSEKQSQKQTS